MKRNNGIVTGSLSLALAAGLLGCDTRAGTFLRQVGESTELVDAPLPAPVAVDVLCDSSSSTCTEKTLAGTLDAILPAVAARPGSVVRLWTLAETVGATHVLAERTSTASSRPSTQSVRAHEQRFIEETKLLLLQASQPVFARPSRRSPIAEAVVKVSLTSRPKGVEKRIILLTDGLEESSLGHFECGSLPNDRGFVRRLRAASLYRPESLKGVQITWCFFSLEPVPGDRCPATLDRYLQTKALWAAALQGAGATVQFETSAPERIHQ